jgi:hypothetical protein
LEIKKVKIYGLKTVSFNLVERKLYFRVFGIFFFQILFYLFMSQSVKTDAGYTGTVIFSKNENF